MIDIAIKEDCTGCYACYSICPNNCIEMNYDKNGFRVPKVNYDNCLKCKKCIYVCPSINKIANNNFIKPDIYASWSLDDNNRNYSTSGGVFSEFAKVILNNGGFVVGAKYNDDNLVEHKIISTLEELELLKQSKYVQSDINKTYKKIKNLLIDNKEVLFCGTPCQVAGLKSFLGEKYNKLLTIDFICRGSNSIKAYKKYLEMLEKKYKSKVEKVWFKNKTYGWNYFSTKIDFLNGKTYIKDRFSDKYMRGYIEENLFIRLCCFNCIYKGFPRIADITLGDFWGVGLKDPSLDIDKGTSLIMINSERGQRILYEVEKYIFCKEMLLDDATPFNLSINQSVQYNHNREKFFELLNQLPFDKCFDTCTNREMFCKICKKGIRKYIRIIKANFKKRKY